MTSRGGKVSKAKSLGRRGRLRAEIVLFFKNTYTLFKQNFKQVTLFIVLCSVFSIAITAALTEATTGLLMLNANTTYIAPVNLADVMLKPLSVVVLAVEQLCAAFLALFQIAGLLHAFSMGQIGLDTTLSSMFTAGLRACRKALHPKNWLIVPFLLVLLPLTKVMSLASTSYKLIIPGFITQTIEYTMQYSILYNVIYAIILGIVLVSIFSTNFFVLREDSFLKSCAESHRLIKGHYLNTVLMLGLLTLLVHAGINTFASATIVNITGLQDVFSKDLGIVSRFAGVGPFVYSFCKVLQGLIVPAANNAGLTVLFYRYIDDSELVGTLSRASFKASKPPRGVRLAVVGVLVAAVVSGGAYLVSKYSFLASPVDRPLVCAHRGDNVNAPENTMPAFELAFSENLPWIELDVHQTSDGVIVCSHDSNLKRVTGQDVLIREHTYDEVAQCEMGEWMPGAYEHVQAPKLEDVLNAARDNGVSVQVELKGSEGDKDFEEHVLDVINKTGMHDNVMVIGQDAKRMMRVAELDPTITKGYCMFVAQGRVEDIPYTDNVTIEETNVTPELVHRLHGEGVKVFCWTVDLQDTVQYLVSCDVDVIGTDNPLLINAALDHVDYSGGLPRFFYIIMNVITDMAR